jgi:hypothetical protein
LDGKITRVTASALARAPTRRRAPSHTAHAAGKPAPWILGIALAAILASVYLLLSPPSGDLAAATYRSNLFADAGFTVWDNGWYAGHSLPAYSLLAPALGAWLGLRVLLALCALGASALFGLLAGRALPAGAARAATLMFAFGFCAELPSGRVAYDLGAAISLAALLPITATVSSRRARALSCGATVVLAFATSAASPVAGAFLALAGVSIAISALLGASKRASGRALLAAGSAITAILLLAIAFPEGGYEPFAAGAFWPELAAAIAIAALLPAGCLEDSGRRTIRVGACLYALALALSFMIKTPMGGNVVRLGAMFGAPILVGALWPERGASIDRSAAARLLLALTPLLLYWQLATAIDDQVALAGDPTVHASFYSPLRSELLRLAKGRPIRVEVPLTNSHWESVYLPGGPISIARGWERQLDTRYDQLFYGRLSAGGYRRWLSENAIAYVALPDAKLDSAGQQERRLIDRGQPYLAEVWRSARWRLFAVRHATPIAQAPAQMLAIGVDSFTLEVPSSGRYQVRLHWTPYWALSSGAGCVSRGAGGFTEIQARSAGKIEVEVEPSLGRLFAQNARCQA